MLGSSTKNSVITRSAASFLLNRRPKNGCISRSWVNKMKNYETEARSRWGNTDAYREHEQKTKNYTKEKWAEANDGMMAIFAEFAVCKNSGASTNSAEAQALVAKLQAHITANYYTCTDEILAGLGQMYVADERFKKNIDKYGEGTAEFAADAIAAYTK
ncbi:MAG: hypothetical protein E7606_06130 [Ruminococcaceae bacterium]|nr:hypothetical protein [Oscillospiraceae bacterium]